MISELFRFDALALFVAIFIAFFFLITLVYSIAYMKGRSGLVRYYIYLLLTAAASLAAVLADNLLIFLIMWGALGLLLFLLVGMGRREEAPLAAKKAFVIIGGTDALMLMGFAILWQSLGGSPWLLSMSTIRLELTGTAALVAFLCMTVGALAKAGAMPFHSWVPDASEHGPLPVTAFLPASLDKLLGIYLLARLVLEMFVLNLQIHTLLMALGAVTIIAAVMMALVQHDLRRLLGYQGVSQVGYMMLGLGSGTLVGAAGGLFHMLNHAIYKSGLFLCGGNVEYRTGTSDLDKLGGLSSRMPVTFVAFLVTALAISGIPPLNGFASKWLIYQGMIESGQGGDHLWMIWLCAAMFGTALTLATFMKLLHAVFLGQSSLPNATLSKVREVPVLMWMPAGLLALLCIVFGVFAFKLPLIYLIYPSVPGEVTVAGFWEPGLATLMILIALVLGAAVTIVGARGKTRVTEPFVGGERLDEQPCMRLSGVQFYRTVRELPGLKPVYAAAEKLWFDPYELCKRGLFALSHLLGALHNGFLPRYLSWCLFGIVLVLYFLMD